MTSTELQHSATEAGSAVTPAQIMEIGLGFWASKTLLSAVELGVFSELAREPLDAEALSARLGLHERSARDFLDALVALELLDRRDGRYSNTPATDLFLDREKPSYVGGLLEMANTRLYPFWGRLTEALKTGEPQNEGRTGDDFFAAIYADPERLAQFLQAMNGLSMGASKAIAAAFPFDRYRTVADVGCAQGGLLVEIARVHPQVSGTGFDLAVVERHFRKYVESAGLADRLRFRPGDFFTDPLPEAEVIAFGHTLHDWGLDAKKELLRKAYDALPDGGAVIVYEAIIDDDRRRNVFGLLMSLNMLIETPAGFDYTGADCQGWLREVGFGKSYVEPLVGPDSMVVGIK